MENFTMSSLLINYKWEKHENRQYTISRSCGVSPGYPGWPVCIITHDQIIDDTNMSVFA
jgi:hypothetical protein